MVGLIQNTIALGILIAMYYFSVLAMQWYWTDIMPQTLSFAYTDINAVMPPYVQTLWWFLVYFGFPIIFIIAFIVMTKPKVQTGAYRGGYY